MRHVMHVLIIQSIKRPLEEMSAADLHLNKKLKTVLKRESNCEHYDHIIDFTKCAEKAIHKEIAKNAVCVFHLSKDVFPNSRLPGK